jgi:hypothetical protein
VFWSVPQLNPSGPFVAGWQLLQWPSVDGPLMYVANT